MSLRTRIALIASAAVAIAVLAIAAAAFVTTQDRLTAEVDRSLTDRFTQARAIGGIVDSFSERRFRGGPFQDPRGFDTLYVQLTDAQGNIAILDGQDLLLPKFAAGSGTEGEAVFTQATVDDVHLRIANFELPDRLGVLQIARSLEEVDATLASLAWTLSLIGVVGIVGAALLGLFIARSSLRPIAQLTEAAERVAETKLLAQRIEVDREDELGRLAWAFNEMMEALESSKDQQRRLVRDAGHELRTPLTALRTNIELLAKADNLPGVDQAAIYDDLNTELAELTDLVNEVVELAAEPEVTEEDSAVDLEELCNEVVTRFRRRASQQLDLRVDSPATVRGRRNSLERALGNLIDNAIKWSPSESTIVVSVVDRLITVENVGSEIDPADRGRVFDRFYRTADARSKPGSGLGLSIVKQVIDSHGGRVFVADAPPGATAVGFEIPAGQTPAISGDS